MKKTLALFFSIVLISSFLFQKKAISKDNDLIKKKELAKALFDERLNKEKLNEAIIILEKIASESNDYESNVLLSRAFYFLAELEEDKTQKLSIYEKGLKAGEKGLELIESFKKSKEETQKEEQAVKTITKDNMEALYWTAANIARWAKFTSFTKKVASKARVRYLWDRVNELDPTYFYGGAYRFYGGYFALVPTITGEQDPLKSKEMFEKCIALAPQYLETKVLYAEAYCTHAKIKDKELFRKLLKEVMAYNLKDTEELLPENTVAQRKAQKLLNEEETLFE